MYTSEKRKLSLYFIIAIATILTAKFIFEGGLEIISTAFKPFIIACVLIYLIEPITHFIDVKTKLNRVQSVITAYILFILFSALFIAMLVPSITDSISSIASAAGSYDEEEIISFINNIPLLGNFVDTSNLSSLLSDIEDLIVEYSSNILSYSSSVISSIGSVVQSIIVIVFAFIMSFYALKDSDKIFENAEKVLRAFVSDSNSNRIVRVASLTDKSFKKFLIGKLYTCLILGAIVTVSILIVNALTPLNIPYALLIGVIIGFTNIIPYVGGIIGTVPAVLIVLLSGFWEAIFVWLIIIVAQQIDNIIIGPKILGDSVGLKPFWIITGITVGGSLFGAVGMIMSVPIMSVILQLIDEKVLASELKDMEEPTT